MKKYTIILEFNGGTYLSQVELDGRGDVIAAWCDKQLLDKPFGARTTRLVKAIQRGSANELTPISGLTGVWAFSALFAGELVLGHVVLSV